MQTKNFFDITKSNLGKILTVSNGELGSAGDIVDTSDYIEVEANQNYVLKGVTSESTYYYNYYICLYDTDKHYIERQVMTSLGSKAFTFTTSQAGFIRFSYVHNITNLQFKKGRTVTPYVPHAEQNLPFTLPEGQFLGSGDSLEENGMHKVRKKHIIINSNVYSIVTLSNGNKGIVIGLPNKKDSQTNTLYCNRAIFNRSFEDGTFYENPTNIVIVGNENDTLETLKEKYIGTVVEYEIEEEIVPYNSIQQTQYNAMKQAMSYDEKTIITGTSSELSPLLNCTALKKGGIDSE